MPLDATEVRVASDGRLYVATVGTAAPADTTTAWAAPWSDMGFASEDGVTITPSIDTEDINAWQSSVPVRSIVTGSSLEVGFTLVQSNSANLALYFNATVASNTLTIPVTPQPIERAIGVEWKDGTKTYRLVIPRAQLSDTGEITLARGEAVGFELTFKALPPATGPLATVLMPPAV